MVIQKVDVTIIGAGPVGLFGSFQAGMLGMKAAIIDPLNHIGGQCSALYPEKPIYDIPGYPQIQAQTLINQLAKQTEPFKPLYLLGQQVTLLNSAEKKFIIKTSKSEVIESKIILIAAGAGAFTPKKPPIPHLNQYEGTSILYSVQNKEVFRNKKIVITGGGDSAIDWAIELSKISKSLHLIHRRKEFRCAPHSLEQLKLLETKGKLKIMTPYQLKNVKGDSNQIQEVIIEKSDNSTIKLNCDFLLPFYGLSMELGPIRNWNLNLSKNYIEVDPSYYQTNIKGIYSIGDIANYPGKVKLILTGFSEASSALHHAYSRVFNGKKLNFQYSTSVGVKQLV